MASTSNVCSHCEKATQTVMSDDGMVCCSGCGRIVKQDIFSTEATFVKGPGGQSCATGGRVKSVASGNSDSYDRTLGKGRDLICEMVDSMQIFGGNSTIDQASGFYRIAVDRNFTRGRSTLLVAAACLYITLRENKKAYLLIDFSEYLQENVYKLGAVFLQLCQLLRLQEHPIFQKPVDPSLFIHRFTERLLGRKNLEVSSTALRIIASMKRDWMQTGRKPSGLCGAALYISALSYGHKYSKSDIVTVVHVCEATLTKRLIEFENTESGSLTIDEFNKKAQEFEIEVNMGQLKNVGCKSSEAMELLCEHKGTGVAHFAHGLCKACYDDFITISGGIQGGSEPPAFQRAERERMAKEVAEENAEEVDKYDKVVECSSKAERNVSANDEPDSRPSQSSCIQVVENDTSGQTHFTEDMEADAGDELENLSDIDDVEVDGYLHNEEEKRYKEILWVEMNKEYLEEQALKEAAAAAARKSYEAQFQNCSQDMLAKKELIEAAQAAVAKSRKEKRQKKAAEAKSMPPPQNVTEAARRELTKKRLSSKINFDALGDLFDDSTVSENTKKARSDNRGAQKIADDSDGDLVQEEDFAGVECGTTYAGDDSYYEDEYPGCDDDDQQEFIL